MDQSDHAAIDALLGDAASAPADDLAPAPAAAPRRDLGAMMRKIPVTLTLEVGSARVSLQDLADIRTDSVVELDTLAGEPLVIKVNGTEVGRAEVVVSGENYALKVVELSSGLDLGALA
ncbi:FliM/FliN family flagellar motor switch protein [Aquabacterium sp. A7-Y]|uniref:FliM/FliN family flagellar motor switch protein n=1 Tax=Aquabacterium sp. A7-Y TaxID=1349605 RepID=UPI00223C8E77|nr:FliM/FliN family flagellar motor switch protein [Aquabacterium sp. A7-Y]MCW7536515.1 FliM/FliN family flagellar motor switch protein [Aquabacterium sp. A7-Y]